MGGENTPNVLLFRNMNYQGGSFSHGISRAEDGSWSGTICSLITEANISAISLEKNTLVPEDVPDILRYAGFDGGNGLKKADLLSGTMTQDMIDYFNVLFLRFGPKDGGGDLGYASFAGFSAGGSAPKILFSGGKLLIDGATGKFISLPGSAPDNPPPALLDWFYVPPEAGTPYPSLISSPTATNLKLFIYNIDIEKYKSFSTYSIETYDTAGLQISSGQYSVSTVAGYDASISVQGPPTMPPLGRKAKLTADGNVVAEGFLPTVAQVVSSTTNGAVTTVVFDIQQLPLAPGDKPETPLFATALTCVGDTSSTGVKWGSDIVRPIASETSRRFAAEFTNLLDPMWFPAPLEQLTFLFELYNTTPFDNLVSFAWHQFSSTPSIPFTDANTKIMTFPDYSVQYNTPEGFNTYPFSIEAPGILKSTSKFVVTVAIEPPDFLETVIPASYSAFTFIDASNGEFSVTTTYQSSGYKVYLLDETNPARAEGVGTVPYII